MVRDDGNESIAGLLDRLTSQRATGCLTLDSPGRGRCSIYILFGHVFHAEGPVGEGSAVLTDALRWPTFTFSFDARAKLPAKETISQGWAAPQK